MTQPPVLTIKKDGEIIKTFQMTSEASLGRDEDCAIRLDDRAISRQHAKFRALEDQGVQVENLSDFAPLVVNGKDCTSAILKDGDTLVIGPYHILLTGGSGGGVIVKDGPSLSGIIGEHPSKRESEPAPPTPVLENFEGAPESLEAKAGDVEPSPLDLSGALAPLQPPEAPNSGDSSGLAEPQKIDELNNQGSQKPDGEESTAPADGGILPIGLDAPADAASPETAPQSDAPIGSGAPDPAQFFEAIGEDDSTKIISQDQVVVKLIFKPGAANVDEFDFSKSGKEEISIGRGKNCDIILNDKKSSRKNTVIRRSGLNFIIVDLGSSNGTFVNSRGVKEQALSGGDIIQVGNTEFEFKATSVDYSRQEKNLVPAPTPVEEVAIAEIPVELPVEKLPDFPNVSDHLVHPVQGAPGSDAFYGGISGINSESKKKGSLIEKFRAQPPRTQIIIVVLILLVVSWLMEDDNKGKVQKKPNPNVSAQPSGGPSPAAKGMVDFESLTPDQKRFVESQHSLAFDYYKNKDYDKAIFEIEKIFSIISDYKDSKEIERYAKEGQRKIEAIEEEKRKKEAEAQLKAKIAQLVEETRQLMEKKQYDAAKELFVQILSLDPDNASVAQWRKDIEAYEEGIRLKKQQKEVEAEINKHAWEVFDDGVDLKREGKYHSAIATFQNAIDIGPTDKTLKPRALKMIAACRALIRALREPLLEEAKKAEDAGDFAKAFALYTKATKVDPPHPTAYKGITRIRGILHEKAKYIYIEAVLAEGYSDFATAKKMFQQCLAIAPVEDIYHERAARKLSHYIMTDEAPAQ